MEMRNQTDTSPCQGCTRVKDPGNCENKNCSHWRKWFLKQWDLLRGYPRRQMDGPRPSVVGDPCSQCASPRELCRTPCRSRRAWEVQQ